MVIAYGVSCFPNGAFFLRAINNQKACFVIILTLKDAKQKRLKFIHCYKLINNMRAIKKVKKFIEYSPKSTIGLVYSRLILSLEAEEIFPINDLYKLNADDFELALELMKDWRIDQFYIGKAKAFDTATHAKNLS